MSGTVKYLLLGIAILGQAANGGRGSGQDSPATAAPADSTVVYFHTEFFPYQQPIADSSAHHLTREFVRQALIATVCDEFGVPALDESLGESVPTVGRVIHLALLERASWKTKQWHIKLFAWDESQTDYDTSQLWNQTPIWQSTYDWPGSIYVFNRLAPIFAEASKAEFSEALKKAGLTARVRQHANSPQVPDEVLRLLEEVDFVSQYRAMQAAQQNLGEYGESPVWLEVLVRSYANLSMLTQHHWSTTSEAFAARSFVYAQRLMTLSDNAPRSLAFRAYSWALGGIHAHALSDLEKIAKQQTAAAAQAEAPSATNTRNTQIPEWIELINHFCHCDREAVRMFGQTHSPWNAWSARLRLFLTSTYGYSDASGEDFNEIIKSCPSDYGVYAAMTRSGCPLGVQRQGAYLAPAIFGKLIVANLANAHELPQSVQASVESAPGSILEKWGLFRNTLSDSSPFSDAPSRIAKQLRIASQQDSSRYASWSILATLIEDEFFIEASNYLSVSRNATEHSSAEVVKQLTPLLQGHRYAAYIESFRFDRVHQFSEFKQSLTNLRIVDPSRSMNYMFAWTHGAKNPASESIVDVAYAATVREFTVQGLYEYCFFTTPSGTQWIPQPKTSFAARLAEEVAKISPHLELGLRMAIGLAEEPTVEQLRQWDSQIREDADSWVLLARHYSKQKLSDDALRCYSKALDLKLDVEIAKELADCHHALGSAEKWESTLEEFIRNSSGNGLSASYAHNELAQGLYYLRKLDSAKQHAVAAAESYSGWGLKTAAALSEILAEWEAAEGFYRALSENYPSYSSEYWYFYCCRTGRGDRSAALKLAERYFTKELGEQTKSKLLIFACFEKMRDEPVQALHYATKALDSGDLDAAFLVAELAQSAGKPELASEVLDKLEEQVKQYIAGRVNAQENANDVLADCRQTLLAIIRSGTASQQQLQYLSARAMYINERYRTRLAYHVGIELEKQGRPDEADLFFRRALTLLARDEAYASLCGLRLSKRQGTSRPDNKPLTGDDLWIQP